jgi:hypothetical protein
MMKKAGGHGDSEDFARCHCELIFVVFVIDYTPKVQGKWP